MPRQQIGIARVPIANETREPKAVHETVEQSRLNEERKGRNAADDQPCNDDRDQECGPGGIRIVAVRRCFSSSWP